MSKKDDLIPYYKTLLLWAYTLFRIWFNKKFAILTKYFPFSLIPESFFLHHKNRDIMQFKNFLFRTSLKSGALFNAEYVDKDDYFISFTGSFEVRPSPKSLADFIKILETEYGKGNVFLKKDNNCPIVSVNRNAIVSDID